jgi:hypothetical protein
MLIVSHHESIFTMPNEENKNISNLTPRAVKRIDTKTEKTHQFTIIKQHFTFSSVSFAFTSILNTSFFPDFRSLPESSAQISSQRSATSFSMNARRALYGEWKRRILIRMLHVNRILLMIRRLMYAHCESKIIRPLGDN